MRASIVALLAAAAFQGQSAPTPSLAFEVASVKPVKPQLSLPKPFGCGFGSRGERFLAFGTLRWLMACAYGIPAGRAQQEMVGGPTWLDVDLFDVIANVAPDDVSRTQEDHLGMLRTLLADRFKLAVHRETKEMPIYALVMARRDGKPGPHLRPTTRECAAWISGGRRGSPPQVLSDVPCGLQRVSASAIRGGAMTMARLAVLLSPRVERLVQDRTGLTGNFDLELQWTPERRGLAPADPQQPSALPPIDTEGLSLPVALQEQLGLKLESTKGPLDVLVIDHVEHPTED